MRRAALDGLDAGGDGVPRAGEGAVADLQFDHVLAGRLETLGDGEDIEGGLGGETAGECAESDSHSSSDKGQECRGAATT